MKRLFLTAAAALSLNVASAQAYQPSPQIKQAQQEFQDQKFGIFLHWGIYSMLGDGEWVAAFKDAGARYITFTTRHHDGFSMFKTATSTYNIVDGTPYAHDVLADLATACRKQGLSLHLYYSHLDWHRLDYPLGRTGRKLGRPTDQQDYAKYFDFMNQQLTELLTNYGKIGCIWFDGWWDHDSDPKPFDWRLDEQYQLIHQLQPQCLVANNHHQKPYEGEDIQIFERDVPGENKAGLSGQDISRLPLETCQTMNDSWGYDITDKNYKSADEIIRLLVNTAGRNANLLLNIGPRPDGKLPQESLDRLKAIGKWLRANGESIYGTRGGVVTPRDWGVTTQKGKTLYVHILNLQDASLFLPVENVKRAVMFADMSPVKVTRCPGGVTLSFSAIPSGVDTIVEVSLK